MYEPTGPSVRVIHILNHTRRQNGHVHAAVDLACAQQELGHTTAIVSGGGDFDELLASNEVQSLHLDQERRPLNLMKAMVGLQRIVRDWKPDVIHAHMMTSAVLAWPVCRLNGVSLVTTVHNEFEKSSILMGLGTRVIAVSGAVARSLQARGLSRSRIDVVLNGTIGSARHRGRSREPLPLAHPNIVFVGGQHPRKGVPDLLEAFGTVHQACPEARLYIVGDGPFLDVYREKVAASGHSNVVSFPGAQDNPVPWMTAADIFVLPSHADPAPLVLSEAREAGCAVVATAVDGIPELLEDGKAGILVPAKDPAKLAEALLSLLQNPAELAAWRERSQVNIENMTIDRVARQTLAVYEAAASRKRRRSGTPKGGQEANAAAEGGSDTVGRV